MFAGAKIQKYCNSDCKNNDRLNKTKIQYPPIINLEGEVWKDAKGFESKYCVSTMGRLKTKSYTYYKRNDPLCYYVPEILSNTNPKGFYLSASFNGTHYRLHIIIARTFIDNPLNKPQVNHINGKKDDNRLINLEWATNSENGLHAYRIGLNRISDYQKKMISIANSGSKSHLSILKESDIVKIRECKKDNLTNKKIGEMFGVCRQTIEAIVNGRTWKHVV